jgi:hypothetical protein
MTQDFLKALRECPGDVIDFEDVHRVYLTVCPGVRGLPGNGVPSLLDDLGELKRLGAVRYSTKSQDSKNVGRHTVPLRVSIRKDRNPKPDRQIRQWDPRVLSETFGATAARLEFLTALDTFLKAKPKDAPLVPIKARSLHIFGDEKLLTNRCRTELRRSGNLLENLTPTDLGCYVPDEHYFVFEAFDVRSPTALVVENTETYHLMKRWNAYHGLYRAIIFGAGKAFPAKAPHLQKLAADLRTNDIRYFGDIDVPGLEIAKDAYEALLDISNITFRPSLPLYRACLDIGIGQLSGYGSRYDWENERECKVRTWAISWFDDIRVFGDIDDLIKSRKRLAQEWTGLLPSSIDRP